MRRSAQIRSIALIFMIASMASVAAAGGIDANIVLQGFGGVALNVPTTLSVVHEDLGSFDHEATWSTEPFDQPFYWALRARWQRDRDGFELQLLHHKMILDNNPEGFEHFEVTHGFNVLTVNYVRRSYPIQPRCGLGVVLPHAESVVGGQPFGSDGYSVAGPAVMIGAGWEHALGGSVLLAADAQLIAGWATVDIADGTARVRSLALHLLFGLGVGF